MDDHDHSRYSLYPDAAGPAGRSSSESNTTDPFHLENSPASDMTRRSIFADSNAHDTSHEPDTRFANPSIFSSDTAVPGAANTETLPLSVLAGSSASAEQRHVSPEDEIRATVNRRRIPRVEKDADDPTTPVQNKDDPQAQENTTSTTLNRLFAVQTHASRSHSFNSPQEIRPRAISHEMTSLTDHLFGRGLLSGKHSDITIHAFGCAYRLHRLILDRAPFFSTAFSGQWLESSLKEITLHPNDVDNNITQVCFELALKRLYGASTAAEEDQQAAGLFAAACWLEMTDLIDSSIESMLRQMTTRTLAPLIKLVTNNYYGRAGDKILASAKAMLCRDGWKMPIRFWDGIPADIIREIVGGDGLFINGEWDRWVLSKRILDRRLKAVALEAGLVQPRTRKLLKAPDTVNLNAIRFDGVYRRSSAMTGRGTPDSIYRWVTLYTHPDVEPLLVLLDEGIHYVHLNFEHLQYMRTAKDILGLPMMPEKVISNALWMQMELRQKVLNTQEHDMELGLSQAAEGMAQENASREASLVLTPASPSKGKNKAHYDNLEDSEETDIPSNSWDENGKPRKFWIPSADCNIVMGGNADPVIATSSAAGVQRHTSRLSATIQPEDVQWAADFGAASSNTRPGNAVRPGSAGGPPMADVRPVAYSNIPPFRFAAEFPNPRLLKEKKRVYSRTIFYAGSLWNIYIQKVRSAKNVQLGVYLHRAKERDFDDAVADTASLGQSSVDERIGHLEREMLMRADRLAAQRRRRRARGVNEPDTEPDAGDSSGSADPDQTLVNSATRSTIGRLSGGGIRKRSQSDIHTSTAPDASDDNKQPRHDGWSTDSSDDDEAEDSELENLTRTFRVPTLPPYVDARPTIKTYFKIYSPSKGGRMLSVYESAPDRFNFSQSWGWKSSTLMLDEGMMDGGGTDEEGGASARKEGRLKFMVVIGNV